MKIRNLLTALGVAVTASTVAIAPVIAAPTTTTSVVPQPAGDVVTLITGDRVTLRGTAATVQGRPGVNFAISTHAGRTTVIPSDAADLVAEGRLDRRLFDVTSLLDIGYGDAKRADVPLLVSGSDTAGVPGVTSLGREFPSAGARGLAVGKDGAFWKGLLREHAARSAKLDRVWLDGRRRITLEQSVPQIGAPAAWQAGYRGAGVTVAVLDTGIDTGHPDLTGKVTTARNFTADGTQADENGHGTHVAGTIAGTGAASSGRNTGVAPEARLLDGKVCDRNGDCAESWILSGMEWAAAEQRAKIVSMSLGSIDTPGIDPLEAAVNRLAAQHGTLFVIAAGNEGQHSLLGSPGSADAALTVGAVDKSGFLAYFSGRGPRPGDGAVKPDVVAPGVGINAPRPSALGGGYQSLNGTSMATPHVSGAAALLLQKRPQATAAELKAALVATAKVDPTRTAFEQGTGLVDVKLALDTSVTATPVGINLGNQRWPHADDTPVTQAVTYRNTGSAPVTLALSVSAIGPDGLAAPASMFALSASSLTVPAGGQAQVTLTADTRVNGADGHYSGHVVAAATGARLTTAFAVLREPESYDLTLRLTDRAGNPSTLNTTGIQNLNGLANPTYVHNANGTVVVRLPRGRYHLDSTVYTRTPAETTFLYTPLVDLTANTTVHMDTRLAGRLQVTVPTAGAQLALGIVGYQRRTDAQPDSYAYHWNLQTVFSFGQIGADVAANDLISRVVAHISDPNVATSPYGYHLAWFDNGRFPTGLTRQVAAGELGTVESRYTGTHQGAFVALPQPTQASMVVHTTGEPSSFALPLRRTEYYNNAGGVEWLRVFEESNAGTPVSKHEGYWEAYQPGSVRTERWNQGPFGFTLLHPNEPDRWITRNGIVMNVLVPIYSDQAGHNGHTAYVYTERTALSQNGQLIAERTTPGPLQAFLTDGPANYRLEKEVTPYGVEFGTRIHTAWTFASNTTTATTPVPVFLVRYTPDVDDRNRVVGGSAFTLPFTVDRQPGVAASALTSLTVDVSYDDGATWQAASVSGNAVTVAHPAQAGYVSLRTRATDAGGVSVEQTVIRAYGLNAPAPTCTAPAWNRTTAYTGGSIVSHVGHRWRAKWWTQGEEPGTTGQWGVWEDLGVC